MKALSDTVVAYKFVWLRVICYWLIPTGLSFLSLTKEVGGEAWSAMHWFDQGKIILESNLVGLVAFVAFLDSSMQRARDTATQLKTKREEQAALSATSV